MKTQDQIKFECGQLAFWNRETYLAWRADWRARYKRASESIRQTKREIMLAYRWNNQKEASALQQQLHFLRVAANAMMKQRRDASKLRDRQFALARTIARAEMHRAS